MSQKTWLLAEVLPWNWLLILIIRFEPILLKYAPLNIYKQEELMYSTTSALQTVPALECKQILWQNAAIIPLYPF